MSAPSVHTIGPFAPCRACAALAPMQPEESVTLHGISDCNQVISGLEVKFGQPITIRAPVAPCVGTWLYIDGVPLCPAHAREHKVNAEVARLRDWCQREGVPWEMTPQ